jgi:geranylgeranyl pyrophosphate synthase
VTGVIARAAGATGMVGGQALDLASADIDGDGLRELHSQKTGALIRAAAVAGAIMGGAEDRVVERVDAAAADFGLAFQIVDDILDVEGQRAQLGKTPGKDAAAGKPTYPALYGIEGARAMAADCLQRAHSELDAAGLATSRLMDIGQWIVERSN